MDGIQKQYMLELLMAATVALCCLDVLCAKWNLTAPASTIATLIGALTALITYVVRDQSVINKTNGHSPTEALPSDT